MRTAVGAQPIKRGRRVCTRRDATMAVHLMLHRSRQSKENLPGQPLLSNNQNPSNSLNGFALASRARTEWIPSRRITSGSLRPGGRIAK